MVKAWFMPNTVTDPRDENQLNPPEPATLEQLSKIGVLYYYSEKRDGLDKIAKERGYDNNDEVVISKNTLPNYEDKVKAFFEEHLHTDEEIRYIADGYGYFDVRDGEDRWIRILSEPGDLLILPAGIYHRFAPRHDDYVHAVRMFRGLPKWEAHNRSEEADSLPERVQYTKEVLTQ
uniref:Acireductone dioxygenase n=1 Tax=Panagrellus redivivus TaxID=6233 RepID=A0A7E4VAQ5_PANRE